MSGGFTVLEPSTDAGPQTRRTKVLVAKSRVDTWLDYCEQSFVGYNFDDDGAISTECTQTFIVAGQYEKLCLGTSAKFSKIIAKDVGRTFPEDELFTSDAAAGQRQLFDILNAFAQYAPDVGYCQGMNFVAGYLLLQVHVESTQKAGRWLRCYSEEECAFWLLVGLMRAPKYSMDGLFAEGLPRLFTTAFQVRKCLERLAPEVQQHLDRLGVRSTTFLPKWLFSIFTTHLPLSGSALAHVWDALFSDGWPALVRVTVALLLGARTALLELGSHDRCAQYLSHGLFRRHDVLKITRLGVFAQEAISDASLDAYAQEMIGSADERLGCAPSAGGSSATSWLPTSWPSALDQLLPRSMLLAMGTDPTPVATPKRRQFSAAVAVASVKSALQSDGRTIFDRAIADIAPSIAAPTVSASVGINAVARDSALRIIPVSRAAAARGSAEPLIEILYGKARVRLPVHPGVAKGEVGTLTFQELRRLALRSFPALPRPRDQSVSKNEIPLPSAGHSPTPSTVHGGDSCTKGNGQVSGDDASIIASADAQSLVSAFHGFAIVEHPGFFIRGRLRGGVRRSATASSSTMSSTAMSISCDCSRAMSHVRWTPIENDDDILRIICGDSAAGDDADGGDADGDDDEESPRRTLRESSSSSSARSSSAALDNIDAVDPFGISSNRTASPPGTALSCDGTCTRSDCVEDDDGILARFEVFTAEEQAAQQKQLQHVAKYKSRLFRGQLGALRQKVEGVYRMVQDPSAAFLPKMVALSALVYVVSPLDAIPDMIPAIGLADDFAVLTALFASFASMSIDVRRYMPLSQAEAVADSPKGRCDSGRAEGSATEDVSLELACIGSQSSPIDGSGADIIQFSSDSDFDDFEDAVGSGNMA